MNHTLSMVAVLSLVLTPAAQAGPTCSTSAPDGRRAEVRIDEPLPGSRVVAAPPCPGTVAVRGLASAVGLPPAIDAVFLLDTSGSSGACSGADVDGDGIVGVNVGFSNCTDPGDSILAAEVAAIRSVLDAVDPRNVRVAVIGFSLGAFVQVPLTSDYDQVRAGLQLLLGVGPGAGTNFVRALDELRAEIARNGAAANRPFAMLMSDGEDTVNTPQQIRDAAGRVAADGIQVDTFAVGTVTFPDALDDIARITGGTFRRLTDPADILIVLPEVVLVGIDTVTAVNLTTGDSAAGRPALDGSYDLTLPLAPGLNLIEVTAETSGPDPLRVVCASDVTLACVDSCDTHTQGYWHRQCAGSHPDWTDAERLAILDAVTVRIQPLGQEACVALDADPPSDKCEKAIKQTAAVAANIASGLLGEGCEVDLSALDPRAPRTAGALVGYLIELILAGDCKLANDLADAVNTGAAVLRPVPALLLAGDGARLSAWVLGAGPGSYTLLRSTAREVPGAPFATVEPGWAEIADPGAEALVRYDLE